jgi:FeS assembly SUF system protein
MSGDPSQPVRGDDQDQKPDFEGAGGANGPSTPEALRTLVVEAIRTCYDPEIPVNVYDLGLIYDVDVDNNGLVTIEMTLTSPACPVAGTLPGEVEAKARGVPGVVDVRLEVVWDPPWTPDMMSEAAKLELGLM